MGRQIHDFAEKAWPICRSITGEGVRSTLGLLAEITPLEVGEIASGTQVFDWVVPREWNLREAWIKDPAGEIVVDSRWHNLHVLGYSVPVARRLPLAELQEHLYSLPEQPELIPYRTSYYQGRWGFCLPHRQREALVEGEYEVLVDASLEPGHLSWGEIFLPGASDDTVLFSTHVCHPSLANDNLSGLGVMVHLARLLMSVERRYSYRFLFVPGTIGSIAWLATHREQAVQVRHGLVAANLGDGGCFHYKRSRRGDAEIDRAVIKVLHDAGEPYEVEDFVPFGYDERQYCSPGFNLAVGSLTRTPWGRYPQYHTSADNLELIRPEHLGASLERYLEVVHLLETNRAYRNLNPFCEPQLGKRGLYRTLGGDESGRERELALLWVLNLSDGDHTLLQIAERAKLPYASIAEAAEALSGVGLLVGV
ncbi:MAG: DUF4910 domain-containing protein [Thermoanaerobaculia bacterium]|nr:DUF4910 domain-containing protein [Thermoanaerobaculia bacterium]